MKKVQEIWDEVKLSMYPHAIQPKKKTLIIVFLVFSLGFIVFHFQNKRIESRCRKACVDLKMNYKGYTNGRLAECICSDGEKVEKFVILKP